jgi:hypothetical protein
MGMELRVRLLPVLLCGVAFVAVPAASAQADAIFDDFNDGVLDTGLWTVLKPFPSSSATESGGKLNLFRRPYVVTADEWFPNPGETLVIEFDWVISSSVSHLNVMTRSDAAWHGAFAEASNGAGVNFSAQADWVWLVRIVNEIGADVPGASRGDVSFLIEPGINYRVRITDDGTNLQVFINDLTTPLVSGAVCDSFAVNHVVFYNREFSITDTLDNVRISGTRGAIPEPGTLVLVVTAFGFLVMKGKSRRFSPGTACV